MKKILIGLFLFTLVFVGGIEVVQAAVPQGTPTNDVTPRIMYWYGKVNQHIDANGTWQTDPDGVSGANIDKLTYCKKWFPNTTSVKDYKNETISTWRERGNVNAWTST
ncbi:MAG: hypothetical protein PHT84_05320, partial [Candidatus Pacebacteria bacterium]|nr:hypothetical protein [Candidatus Paceibacterota bacterium]